MLLVAIPALNEEGSIADVITEVQNQLPQAKILVIDDGSSDRTAAISKSAGAEVLSLPFNIGVGGALRLAFRYAHMNGFDSLIQIDADGQHIPSEAAKLIAEAEQNSVVVGSRFTSGFNDYKVSASRKIVMILLAKILSLICRVKLTDVTSGFRIATGAAIEEFSKNYPRDYLGDTVESLIVAKKSNLLIKEIPVQMRERQSGAPSQNFFKSVGYLSRILLVISLSLFRKNKT